MARAASSRYLVLIAVIGIVCIGLAVLGQMDMSPEGQQQLTLSADNLVK